MRRLTTIGLGLAVLSATAVAVTDASSAAAPSLTISVAFTKSAYVSGQKPSATLKVHNSGTSPAKKISVQQDYDSTELAVNTGGFGQLENGVTIPAGHTITVTVPGRLGNVTATKVTLGGFLVDSKGDGVGDFSTSAPVKLRTSKVHFAVFGDRNASGRPDSGEGVRGIKIHIGYAYGSQTFKATTARKGKATLTLPVGRYYLRGTGKGWSVIPRGLVVGTKNLSLSLRAVHPLKKKVLTASMHFTKARYKVGAKAQIDITLENTGSALVRGIGPECDHIGNANELRNSGRGWGRLAEFGPGVTLTPHHKRTFHVTGKVPAAAKQAGEVLIECDFGYTGVEKGYRPYVSDTAKVPGAKGNLAGQVGHTPKGKSAFVGLKNVRVVLVDSTVCPVLTRKATTNAKGEFHIGHVPAGSSYQLYVYPPKGWKVSRDNPAPAMVFGSDTIHVSIQVERGSASTPSVPTKCS